MAINTIGAAGDFPDVATWAATLGTLSEHEYGQILDDDFVEPGNPLLTGIATSPGSEMFIESAPGAFHGGAVDVGAQYTTDTPGSGFMLFSVNIANLHIRRLRVTTGPSWAVPVGNFLSALGFGGSASQLIFHWVTYGCGNLLVSEIDGNLAEFENIVAVGSPTDAPYTQVGAMIVNRPSSARHVSLIGYQTSFLFGGQDGDLSHCYAGSPYPGSDYAENQDLTDCATMLSAGDSNGTGVSLFDIDPTEQFGSVVAPLDLALLPTADLIGAGGPTSVAVDFADTPRDQVNGTIGHAEFVALGPQPVATEVAWRIFVERSTAVGWRILAGISRAVGWQIQAFLATITGWRIRVERPGILTGWRIRAEQTAPSGWRLLAAVHSDIAWRNFIAFADNLAWQIKARAQHSFGWRLKTMRETWVAWAIQAGAETTVTGWRILAERSSGIAWRLRNRIEHATGWRLFNSAAAPTGWRLFNVLRTFAGWRILSGTVESLVLAWRVRTRTEQSVAWRLVNAATDAVAWRKLRERVTLHAWRVRSEMSDGVAWRLRNAQATDSGWTIKGRAVTATAWSILSATLSSVSTAWRVFTRTEKPTGWRVRVEHATATAWEILGRLFTSTFVGWRLFAASEQSIGWRLTRVRQNMTSWRMLRASLSMTAWRLGVVVIVPSRVAYATPRTRIVEARAR